MADEATKETVRRQQGSVPNLILKTTSSCFELPSEVRNQIYEYAFDDEP